MHPNDLKTLIVLLIGLMLLQGTSSFADNDDILGEWKPQPATDIWVHMTPSTKQTLTNLIARTNKIGNDPNTSQEELKNTAQTVKCILALVNAIGQVKRDLNLHNLNLNSLPWLYIANQVDQARRMAQTAEDKAVTEQTRAEAENMANELRSLHEDGKKYTENLAFVPELMLDVKLGVSMTFPKTTAGTFGKKGVIIYPNSPETVNLNTCRTNNMPPNYFLSEDDFIKMLSSQALKVLREEVDIDGVLKRAEQIYAKALAEENSRQIGQMTKDISLVLGDDHSTATPVTKVGPNHMPDTGTR